MTELASHNSTIIVSSVLKHYVQPYVYILAWFVVLNPDD